MTESASTASDRFPVTCPKCQRKLLARQAWIGRDVACPYCHTPLHVPPPNPDGSAVLGTMPRISEKRSFNFACPKCDSLLEGHTGLSGREGSCPTCGVTFRVPELGRKGRPGPVEILAEPDDVNAAAHAYGASGAEAPRIERGPDGTPFILCPRCDERNEIEANHCSACGTPFTLDGAPRASASHAGGVAVASLIVGVLSLPGFMLCLPAMVAVGLGLAAWYSTSETRRPMLALVGMALGGLSLIIYALFAVFGLLRG